MKTVTLRLDPITRITLIVIAAALVIIAVNKLFPTAVEANPQIIDVNIAKVFGTIYGELPVEFSNEVDVNIARIFGEVYAYKTRGKLPVYIVD